jgi:hypothetical protein
MNQPPPLPIDIADRRELFIDDFLIAELRGATLALQTPIPVPLDAEAFADAGYATVVKDGPLYRAWYRAYQPDYILTAESSFDGNPGEYTATMHSSDGVHWTRPSLGLYCLAGSFDNNAVLAYQPPFSHNFTPMLDTRPAVPAAERYKALAGIHHHAGGKNGLHAFVSPDGIHWRLLQAAAVVKSDQFAFDSQNVSFWSQAEGCYVCYYRSWLFEEEGNFSRAFRSISRRTSPDYIQWSDETALHPNEDGEHLYTNQTSPYFRAPHIYISLPTRFMPQRGESTDILFMSSRPSQRGPQFDRTFRGAFIRPGLDSARWGNRSNYTALNVIPTAEGEMSIYLSSNSIKEQGRRLVLRTDGFAAVHAGWEGGEMRTHPLLFSGSRLEINYATSAAGSLRVEIQTADGTPIPGFDLVDCPPIIGDQISRVVAWGGTSDLSALAGLPLRLRFVLREADLFSLRFFDPLEAEPPAIEVP